MSYDWEITISVWPYFTGAGAEEDQKAAGPREFKTTVYADDMQHALKAAELLAKGIRHNPRVWQTPIQGIVHHAKNN